MSFGGAYAGMTAHSGERAASLDFLLVPARVQGVTCLQKVVWH